MKRLTGAGKDTGMYIILLFLLYLAGRCVEQTGRARAPAYSGEGHMDPYIRQEGEHLFCPDVRLQYEAKGKEVMRKSL